MVVGSSIHVNFVVHGIVVDVVVVVVAVGGGCAGAAVAVGVADVADVVTCLVGC